MISRTGSRRESIFTKNSFFSAGIYEVPTDVSKTKSATGPFTEPVSAILAPSSITHKSSPTLQLRTKELDPSADTGKDTQQLVEEDKSDC